MADSPKRIVKGIQANERDAWAKLEVKFQAAVVKVQLSEEEAQSAKEEAQSAEAKFQSAEKAVEEAKEYRGLCDIELDARMELGMAALYQARKKHHEWQARVDAKIQACQELLDKARQEEMTLDASPAGESG